MNFLNLLPCCSSYWLKISPKDKKFQTEIQSYKFKDFFVFSIRNAIEPSFVHCWLTLLPWTIKKYELIKDGGVALILAGRRSLSQETAPV
jgi:hypothetical protein